jgi:hypothetical protein
MRSLRRALTITFRRAQTSNIVLTLEGNTNSKGHFKITFVVPSTLYQGGYYVVATDGSVIVNSGFKIIPKLYVSEASVAPGSSFILSGNGFDPSYSLSFRMGTGMITPKSVVMNSTSGFSESVTVPASTSAGTYLIQASKPFAVSVTITVT